MGCLPSRSTTVRPADQQQQHPSSTSTSSGQINHLNNSKQTAANGYSQRPVVTQANGGSSQLRRQLVRPKDNNSDSGTIKQLVDIGTSFDMDSDNGINNNNNNNDNNMDAAAAAAANDDILSILMDEQDGDGEGGVGGVGGVGGNGDNEQRSNKVGGDIRNINNSNSSSTSDSNRNSNSNRNRNSSSNSNTGGGGGGSSSIRYDQEAAVGDSLKSRLANATATTTTGGGGGGNGNGINDNGDDMVNDTGIVALPGDRGGGDRGGAGKQLVDSSRENSFDDELNVDLLRQYIAVDYEIGQLEDRDAIRVYHEKIEQLEQLERELNMISFEAEEMAVRNDNDFNNIPSQLDRALESPASVTNGGAGGGSAARAAAVAAAAASIATAAASNRAAMIDLESNSIISGATGTASMSPKSSIMRSNKHRQQQQQLKGGGSGAGAGAGQQLAGPTTHRNGLRQHHEASTGLASDEQQRQQQQQQQLQLMAYDKQALAKENNLSYSTIEDVFSRKIILEKERDKLKKEVELVIIECDKLQQRYKRRDEILDKLFDGRTGNGLENHLEQQLNWLMEQKHYVDQVFYAWKRAETLTSQTCEQFASALELLKRSSKVHDVEQRGELANSICQLLIKSRQDMEQAQRYNPNVDAPFFTDAETERFDKIIETLQAEKLISQSEYNQMATVVQFAYKRAVSIRLWLEQILQITIARDSFELAEEYKWIAIQLRKERISLINSKLQDAPYRSMAQSIIEQLTHQHQQQQQQQQQLLLMQSQHSASNQAGAAASAQQRHQQQQQQQQRQQLAITDGKATPTTAVGSSSGSGANGRQHENNNRDSGIESDDIDIEEDINRLLEMNKSRLEAAVAASKEAGVPQAMALDASGRPLLRPASQLAASSPNSAAVAAAAAAAANTHLTNGFNGGTGSAQQQQQQQQQQQFNQLSVKSGGSNANSSSQRDQIMRDRVERRVQGDQKLASSMVAAAAPFTVEGGVGGVGGVGADGTQEHKGQAAAADDFGQQQQQQQPMSAASSTPSKLRVQLDETSRQDLLNQVYQIHTKHRQRLDDLRGTNKAKTSDTLMSKLQRPPQPPPSQQGAVGGPVGTGTGIGAKDQAISKQNGATTTG